MYSFATSRGGIQHLVVKAPATPSSICQKPDLGRRSSHVVSLGRCLFSQPDPAVSPLILGAPNKQISAN